jgi:hypothetical protein
MTRFVLRGRRGDQLDVTLAWEDGALSGDPDAAAMVRDLAAMYEGKLMGPPGGPRSTRRHLEHPFTAYELMRMVYARGYAHIIEGSLPPLHDDLPPGAKP